MVKKIISIALLSALLALCSANVSAADISAFPGATVTNDGNAYVVEVNSDANLTQGITFPSSATVTVNGNNHIITRDSSYTGAGFSIPNGTTVTINSLTIDGNAPDWAVNLAGVSYYDGSNGTRVYGRYPITIGANDVSASASFIDNSGNLTINNSTIRNNLISNAMAIWNRKNLTVVDSTFDHNCARTTYGGAIYSTGGTLTITGSTFSNNNAGSSASLNKNGGAININSGTATIDSSTFTSNSAVASGGAIMVENANVDINNSTFRSNIVGNDGSAILLFGTYTRAGVANFTNNKYIENKTLTYNKDKGNGEGTISTYGRGFATITVDGDEYIDNQASWGSVLSLYDTESPHSLKNVSVKNVKASGNKSTNGSAQTLYIQDIANVIVDNYISENDQGIARIAYGSSAIVSNVKTDGSWHVVSVDDVTVEKIEVNGREGNYPYFNLVFGENIVIKDFSAKTPRSSALPEIYGFDTLDLENVNTEGCAYIESVKTASIDTLTASGDNSAIVLSNINDVTAKNITAKGFTTNYSALSLSKIAKGELEDITVSNIDANGTSPLVLDSVGEINIKNLIAEDNTNTNSANSIIAISDSSNTGLPANRAITFESAKITNNKSAGLGGGLMITTRNIPVTFDENSIIINNESEAGGDDVYIAAADSEPQLITLPNVIWEDEQEEEAIILGSIVISDTGAHYLKVTTIAENPVTSDNIHYEFAIIGCVLLVAGTYLVRARRNYRR